MPTVKDVEIHWLDVPLRAVPARNMARSLHGWSIIEICRVTTDNGFVGIGETLPHYTWGPVTDEAIGRVRGRNPFELMWDDTLGAGLQMALFDVAGKLAEVPVHRLLGARRRRHCPLSWWAIDMPPEDAAAETREAASQGFTHVKQKARPWWDVYEQARLSDAEAPADFKLHYDFNRQLLNAGLGSSVLAALDTYPSTASFEEPIPPTDVAGYERLRRGTSSALIAHYDTARIPAETRSGTFDGYVIGGGASTVMENGRLCDELNLPFKLQLVGTAWTTMFAMHLGAVLRRADWPAVTCVNVYTDQLTTEPLTVDGGYLEVTDEPGLGIELDESALRFQVDAPTTHDPRALYAIVRPTGRRVWFADEFGPHGYGRAAVAGTVPYFEHGVRLETWLDDGSTDWRLLRERVSGDGPVWTSS